MAGRNLLESPLYTILNYVYWFLMGNIFFFLMNIPLLLVTFGSFGSINAITAIIIFIALIPVGPALTALFYVMGKLVRTKDLFIMKDFFGAYKKNFKQSLAVWSIDLALIGIFIVDIQYFSKTSFGFITPLFLVLIVLVLASSLYAFPIISRFYVKTKDVFVLSFYYAIRKLHITIFNIAIVVICFFVIIKVNSMFALFFTSIICYLIMYYNKPIIKEIEVKTVGEIEEDNKEKNPDVWHVPDDNEEAVEDEAVDQIEKKENDDKDIEDKEDEKKDDEL